MGFLSAFGEDKLRKLMQEGKTEKEIAEICQVSSKTVSRAWMELKARTSKEIRYDLIESWDDPRTGAIMIPEIKNFQEYMRSKNVAYQDLTQWLQRFWIYLEKKRPSMWTMEDVQKILSNIGLIPQLLGKDRLTNPKIGTYGLKQAFRRFFEAEASRPEAAYKMAWLKDLRLRARARDMKSGNGVKRAKDRFSPSELKEILEQCDNDEERLAIKLHVTLKCREGKEGNASLLGLNWASINWTDNYYGLTMATADVFESKTGGGTYWRHCPIDLWFKDLSQELKAVWEKLGSPREGHVFKMDYKEYSGLWQKISERMKGKFEAHDCRRSPSGWLRDLGLSDLAIGQYSKTSGDAVGFAGVGWENAEIFYSRYGKMNPLAIYDKSQRLNVSFFDGLIQKILENKA